MLTKWFSAAICVLALLSAVAEAAVTILEPSNIKGALEHEVSTFGFVDYQATVTIQIFNWWTSDGCEPPDDGILSLRSDSPKAFLMKRGGCPYTQKALNAKKAGARVALVYHDDASVDIHDSTPVAPTGFKDTNIPPVVLIGHKDGLKIKKALDATAKVKIEFDYEIMTYKVPVDVRFVFSPLDENSVEIFKSLLLFNSGSKNSTVAIKNHTKELMVQTFAPKVMKAQELGYTNYEAAMYCLPNFDACAPASSSGLELLNRYEEVVVAGFFECMDRSLRIGNLSNNTIEVTQFLTWYITSLKNAKSVGTWNNMLNSIVEKMEQIGGSFNRTLKCIDQNIFKYEERIVKTNAIFMDDLMSKGQLGFMKLPSMLLEGKLVRGDLTPLTALSAFCDVLERTEKPRRCYHIEENLGNWASVLLDSTPPLSRLGPIGTWVVIFFLTAAIVLFVYSISRRVMVRGFTEDVSREIDDSIARYHNMKNTRIQVTGDHDSHDTELAADHN